VFSVRQSQFDDHYVLVSINLARDLFEYDAGTVTSVELKVAPGADVASVKKDVLEIIGSKYQVKDRFEQQESFFKIVKLEKWIAFLILCFILLIASFNIIGSLSMLIIDKKQDIQTLRSLGADNSLIKRIFLFEGWLISVVGAIIGLVAGVGICLIQEHYGIVKLGSGYIVDAYPVITNTVDALVIFVTVLIMGFMAAWYPVRYIRKTIDD
jgi:ABC-type lipoprotein release transport system permease subunit